MHFLLQTLINLTANTLNQNLRIFLYIAVSDFSKKCLFTFYLR